jgi:hypothetical protein
MRFIYHQDPGHGWVEVPLSLLVSLGIAGQISSFSYRDTRSVFLEEDCDASRFKAAMDKAGQAFDVTRVHYRHDAPCRLLPCYRA